MTTILQKEETLDSCLLGAFETFLNGCNFRLLIKRDGTPYLTYGCYGVHTNLVQGKQRLLMNWLEENKDDDGKARLNADKKTILELMSRRPCNRCGGTRHEISEVNK